MVLSDLLVESGYKNYQAQKIFGEIRASINEKGLYRARSAQDVRSILTTGQSLHPVYVRSHRKNAKWHRIKPPKNN